LLSPFLAKVERLKNARAGETKSFSRSLDGCSDATPVASTYRWFRTDGSAWPSTLLAQARNVVPDVAIESFEESNQTA
jgi:hypothetical protein